MVEPGENLDVLLKYLVEGGLLKDGQLARKIAALLIEHHYGADELGQQQPLNLADEGQNWLITGSAPRREDFDDRSAMVVRLSKRDGRIVNFHHIYHITPDPDLGIEGPSGS
jgi:hypothetical protein